MSITTTGVSGLVGVRTPGPDGMAVLREVLGAVGQWIEVHETETTKRAVIAAQERAVLREIAARRDVFLTYLDRSFDERASAFAELFAALDRAMTDRPEHVAGVLEVITGLAARSPFADLGDLDLVTQQLADPRHEWTA